MGLNDVNRKSRVAAAVTRHQSSAVSAVPVEMKAGRNPNSASEAGD
jgi:hypothetical protein